MIASAILALALGQTPTPTPEPTPTPVPTPTPETRPPGFFEDVAEGDRVPVTSARAPEDYVADRWRGMVPYRADWRNYSFHRVILPAGPLTITGANFTQARAGTVVFYRIVAAGTGAQTGAVARNVTPDGYAPRARDVGCYVRFGPFGPWTRGLYDVQSENGTRWTLDRAPAPAQSDNGRWRLICPVRDFSEYTFTDCNLVNAWLPSFAYRPTISGGNRSQSDLSPEPTPE